MDAQRKSELAASLNEMGRKFWAGEAEICRQFWGQPRTSEEQAHWLRLQMYGSGLVGNPGGLIRAFLEELHDQVGNAETKEQRHELERSLRVLREEYNHFKLFADALETATGQPVSNESMQGWQLDEDKKLQSIRQRIREQEGAFGELAIMFTEGGGSAFFLVGRDIKGDALADQIAQACEIVYTDEIEHGEHGALDLERELDSEGDWAKAREFIIEICQQRLRMRYGMFALPIDERRITEITEGNIEPLTLA
jgi:hypothetical protein